MKIRHKDYGEVDGVVEHEEPMDSGWEKHVDDVSMFYLRRHGWSEVPETRVVDVTGELEARARPVIPGIRAQEQCFIDSKGNTVLTVYAGYVGRKVDRYDLPPDLIERLENDFPLSAREAKELCDYLEAYIKPCLIIQKEEDPCHE